MEENNKGRRSRGDTEDQQENENLQGHEKSQDERNNEDHMNDKNEDEDEEESSVKQQSSQESQVKKFYVFLNGNIHDPPKAFAWNPKQIRTWEAFLEELTHQLKPRTGPIRDIKTPHGGRRITNFEEIESQGKYVAIPRGDHFRQMDYENTPVQKIASNRFSPANTRQKKEIQPVVHSRIQMNAKVMEGLEKKSKTIFIFKNTDPFHRNIRILLKPNELTSMFTVFQAIEERVVLPQSRPLRKLYTVEGEEIEHPDDIMDGGYYVAASLEPFQPANYGNTLPPLLIKRVIHRPDSVKYLRHPATPSEDAPQSQTRRTPRSTKGSEADGDISQEQSSENQSVKERSNPQQGKKPTQTKRDGKPMGKKTTQSSSSKEKEEEIERVNSVYSPNSNSNAGGEPVQPDSSNSKEDQQLQNNQTSQSKAR